MVVEKYRLSFNLESPVDSSEHLILPVGTSRRGGAGGVAVPPPAMVDNCYQFGSFHRKSRRGFLNIAECWAITPDIDP